ncbi:MAG: hypothetical protein KatS3mg094_275 [Candidatus Parcubacteria bacterium]|nr:MAG: hypothetical protein KatS3mg094_275 [Candidatus Parcubacteria bacterium]
MKSLEYLLFFIALIFFLIFLFNFIFITKKLDFIREESKLLFSFEKKSLPPVLILGKMGTGYIGGENTDSIFAMLFKNNKVYIIHIPRDLIVKIDNDLLKINSLYSLKKTDYLLSEISKLTGLNIKKYFVFDLYILKKTIDYLGGLEVDLKYPVTDAVTGYTLMPGKRKFSSSWIEFIVRSRYYPQGDFERMKNQFIILTSLKERLLNSSEYELLGLFNLILQSKNHYETNLNHSEIFKISKQIKKSEFKEILIDLNSKLWTSDYFNIKFDFNVSGLMPKAGIGNYEEIREEIQKKITQEY